MPAQIINDQVAAELMSGPPHPGLWARAYALADGDLAKARARYIALRVEQLKAEFLAEEERRRDRQQHEQDEATQQLSVHGQAQALERHREYQEAQARLPWYKRDGFFILAVVAGLFVFCVVAFVILAVQTGG